MDQNLVVNIILPIIATIVAIIALFQTNLQIRISNKQYLFERRIKIYTVLLGLINLYKENEYLLKENHKEDEPIDVQFLFYGLINNSFLEEQHFAIEKPLEQPYQKKFLIKLEELASIANEIKYIFRDFEEVSQFIINYKEILHSIYKYQNINNQMLNISKQFKKTYLQSQKNVNEPFHRNKLFMSYKNLILSYEKMEKKKSLEKMEKEIKL